jgi:serine/threonine protein kinase
VSETRAARFKRLEPLLDRALELEGQPRERFLALCAEIHPDLIADLRRALQPDALPDIGAVAASATAAPATDRRGLNIGNWRLIERLGRGGMSSVYRAERILPPGLQAAVKMLRGGDLAHRDLFERERGLLARLVHPGIARLLDGGSHRDQPYLVLELAEGLDLDDWLERVQPSLDRRLAVLLQIAEAVTYAHDSGVLHRDLKPSNVRIDGADRSKLLDFGIGKSLDAAAGATRYQALTPDFAAPEQLLGEPTGPWTDIYALGTLLYWMLLDRGPFARFDGNWAALFEGAAGREPPAPSELARAMPQAPLHAVRDVKAFDAVAAQATARQPARRHPGAMAFAQALRALLRS